MNHKSYLPIVALLLSSTLVPQHAIASSGDVARPDKAIATRIDRSLGSLHEVTKDFETGTDRGGALTGYLHGQTIEKIAVNVGLSSKDDDLDYYFHSGRLVMVKRTERQYGMNDKTNDLDFTKPQSTKTQTWYLDNGRPAGTKSQRADEVTYLHDAAWLSRAIMSKSKSIDAVKWVTGG